MSNSSGSGWAAIGTLATVVGVVIAYVALMDQLESRKDPIGDPATDVYGPDYSESPFVGDTPGAPIGGDTDVGGTGGWVEADSFRLQLYATGDTNGGRWELMYDLDANGYAEATTESGEYADWTDLTWQSCGGGYIGYLYGYYARSLTVGSGETADPTACADAVSASTVFQYEVDPASPPSTEGCLYTSDDVLATVALAGAYWNGDHVEGAVDVTLWTWVA